MALVLLVEDDESFRQAIRRVLEQAGHEVVEAGDGEEACSDFDPDRFDLVITDLLMPRQDGIETIQDLRRRAPDVPIIAVSGGGWNSLEVYLKMATCLGATRTLAKPFDSEVLVNTVAEVLAR
jgi:DNA-binding response OmpR family regulator